MSIDLAVGAAHLSTNALWKLSGLITCKCFWAPAVQGASCHTWSARSEPFVCLFIYLLYNCPVHCCIELFAVFDCWRVEMQILPKAWLHTLLKVYYTIAFEVYLSEIGFRLQYWSAGWGMSWSELVADNISLIHNQLGWSRHCKKSHEVLLIVVPLCDLSWKMRCANQLRTLTIIAMFRLFVQWDKSLVAVSLDG